jgi:HEAT repeat protein
LIHRRDRDVIPEEKSLLSAAPRIVQMPLERSAAMSADTDRQPLLGATTAPAGDPVAIGIERPADIEGQLESPDPAVRFNAALDMAKRGDPAGVPALIEAFAHESGVVRLFHAGRALVALGAPVIPMLEAALSDERTRVRVDAALTLFRIDPSRRDALLPVAIDALAGEDRAASEDAVTFLGEAGARDLIPDILPYLSAPAALADPEAWQADPRVRVAALLGHLASPAKDGEAADPAATAALVAALRAELPPARVETLLGAKAAPAGGPNATRWAAARALGELGGAAREAVAALVAVVRDEEDVEAVRVEAAYALAVMGDPAREALPALLAMLGSGDPWARVFAARVLGEIGEPNLLSDTDQPRSWMHRAHAARRQVRRMEDPTPLIAPLAGALADPTGDARRNAAYALSRLGERAAPAVPALVAAFDAPETGPVAAEALARTGGAAVPALAECLAGKGEERRALAAYALGLIDAPAARGALAAAGRTRPVVPFTPAVPHFYVQAPVEWSDEKREAFEALYQATLARGPGSEVEYALPYPRHEFLRYMVEAKRLLLHGTGRGDLEVLQPLRWSTDGADHGNVSGVYADRDPIRPIYFAVVHRDRCFGLNNGFFDMTEAGEGVEGEAPTCERRYYRLALSVNGLPRDPWCCGTVYILPEESFSYWREWTSRAPVRPLMRLAVSPDDLPLRDQVWGVDWRQPVTSWVRPDQPFPFLTDVQATPIRDLRSLRPR